MKVYVSEAKLRSLELVAAQNYGCSIEGLIERAELVYNYIFENDSGQGEKEKSEQTQK